MAIGVTHAGLKLSISTDQPPTYDVAGFTDPGVNYTEINRLFRLATRDANMRMSPQKFWVSVVLIMPKAHLTRASSK